MKPGMRPGKSPPFYDMGEYAFQDMCRDLMAEQPDIATCDHYGVRGQQQHGIDLLAVREGGNGVDVGQCKCYEQLSASDIRDASAKFLRHWAYWCTRGVRRFILLAACDLSRTQQQDEIAGQRRQFAKLRVAYEAWSAATIKTKLRPYHHIVARYFHDHTEYWVRAICGYDLPPLPADAGSEARVSVAPSIDDAQLELLGARLSEGVAKELEAMRRAWREGRRDEAANWVQRVMADAATWDIAAPSTRARVLRLAAALELDSTGDIARAKELAHQALALAPEDNHWPLDALIVSREKGPRAGAERLEGRQDLDSLNLRAALLMDMGCIAQGRSVLGMAATQANAETFRLWALSDLSTKGLQQARIHIDEAYRLEPKWESVELARAMVDYLEAHSTPALPAGLVAWPQPVDWTLIRRDDHSLAGLSRAAEAFSRVAKRLPAQSERRKDLQAWELACLADHPQRQEEAAAYCGSLLRADATNHRAIIWATARGLGLDLGPSEKRLASLVGRGEAGSAQILALAAIYAASGRYDDGLTLLCGNKAVLDGAGQGDLWTAWYAQLLAARGDIADALAAVRASDARSDLEPIRAGVLVLAAERSGDCREALQELERLHDETGNGLYLLEACEVMASHAQWRYVADHASQLVREVATASAVRLGAVALHEAGLGEACLRFLGEHRALFPQGRLPPDLRRLRAACLRDTGSWSEAAGEIEALVRQDLRTRDLLALASLHLARGDMRRAAVVARDLRGRTDLKPEEILGLVGAVRLEDPHLARVLWKDAESLGIPDETVGLALIEGFRLGMDGELRNLTRRLEDLSGGAHSGVRKTTIDELRGSIAEHTDRLTEASRLYRQGAICVHLLTEQTGTPLVDLYHRMLGENQAAPDPAGQLPLYIRHGGRGQDAGWPMALAKPRLFMDLTAILLARHVGILPLVESTFAPVHISSSLMPALLQMRDNLLPTQPSILEDYTEVVRLVEADALRVTHCEGVGAGSDPLAESLGSEWVGLYNAARQHDGAVVCFLPLGASSLTSSCRHLPVTIGQHIVDCRGVVDALWRHGPLSATDRDRALAELGTEGVLTLSHVVPRAGTRLYLQRGIAGLLAHAGVLRAACERFEAYMDAGELARVRAALEDNERRRAMDSFVANLMDHIRQGIDDGMYRLLPPPGEAATPQSASEAELLQCFLDLLGSATAKDDVVWVDDRWITGFLRAGQAQVVGISEILKYLLGAGRIQPADCYSYLAKLRGANARFLPLETGEILYHLNQAQVRGKAVVETSELSLLRRYIAACLLDGGALQPPNALPTGVRTRGEAPFLIATARAVADALLSVWTDESADEAGCCARSEWLVSSLYLDLIALFGVAGLPLACSDDRKLVAVTLAGLIGNAIGLAPGRGEQAPSRQQQYLAWLDGRVLQSRFDAEPALLSAVATVLKDIVAALVADPLPAGKAQAVAAVAQQFLQSLPGPLRDHIQADREFLGKVGLVPAVSVDGLLFRPREYWEAAAAAVNGRTLKVRPVGSDSDATFTAPGPDEAVPGFHLTHPALKQDLAIHGDDLALLNDSPASREETLRRNRHWFDCPQSTFDAVLDSILREASPETRMDRLEWWRKANMSAYYEDLYRRMQSQHFDPQALLPPRGEALLWYLRLREDTAPGRDLLEALAGAGSALMREETLLVAIHRLSGLPVPLPRTVLQGVAKLSTPDRRSLFGQLVRLAGSPVSRAHLLHLLLHCGAAEPACERLARRLAAGLLGDDARQEFEAFTAILAWTHGVLGKWQQSQSWPSHIRLLAAWAHSHELCRMFAALGVLPTWICETFRAMNRSPSLGLFEREPASWFDVSHPRLVNWTTFTLSAAAYAVGDRAAAFLDDRLRDLYLAHAFIRAGSDWWPSVPLLKDVTRAGNALGSFLGGDRGPLIAPILGPEIAENVSASGLQQLLGVVVDALAQPAADPLLWNLCYAILGDFPPDPLIAERLASALRATDFAALCTAGTGIGCLAIYVASLQVARLADEALRQRLKEQLVRVAELAADGERSDTSGGTAAAPAHEAGRSLLLAAAHNLAVAVHAERSAIEEFTEIAGELLRASKWTKSLVTGMSTLTQLLSDELPTAEARHIWPLLVQLRAE